MPTGPLPHDWPGDMPAQIDWMRSNEFPLTKDWAYLNHAGTGTLPASHVRAATQFLRDMSETKPPTTLLDSALIEEEVRQLGARILGARDEDVAVLCSTTEAMALVPRGLQWADGDEVILYARDFPNVVYPWLQLGDCGVRVKFIPDRGNRFELNDLRALLSPRTRVVALSWVQFAYGFRAPIEQIGEICRSRSIWYVVDGIQGMGVLPLQAADLGADVLAGAGYKHLLSGYAVGLCYCSERARAELRIPAPGWQGTKNYSDASDLLNYSSTVFVDAARRFEPAVPSFSGLHGAVESLKLLNAVGASNVEKHVIGLLDRLVDELRGRDYRINSSLLPAERSTLLSISPPGAVDYGSLTQRFLDRRVAVSIREGAIRISPHMYNTWDDMERLLEALP